MQKRVGQIPFFLVELYDFFFDSVLADQPVDGYRSGLPDPVRPVRSLVLNGRVPPRIHVDHIVRGGQVQTKAPRFQRNQKQIAFTGLKGFHAFFAVFTAGTAVQVLIGNLSFIEVLSDDIEVADKLAEDQDLVSPADQLLDQ